jgi:formamidopyrimidine-DNA glycosylase
MPELPEVETIRQDLRKKMLHKKITEVKVFFDKVVGGKKKETIKSLLENSFSEVDRVGKLLIFRLEKNDEVLLLHLKMTGQLIYLIKDHIFAGGHSFALSFTPPAGGGAGGGGSGLPNKYTQIMIAFADHSKLFFNDSRRFGYAKIIPADKLESVFLKFGPEPLQKNFTFEKFSELLKKKKMNVKALLLNQQLIAGIGNIYADEICFDAKVLPTRRTTSLSNSDIKQLFHSTLKVLKKAIEYRGTTFNDYVDSEGKKGNFSHLLKVYERDGERCKRCKGVIMKKKVAGRGTHVCEHCQK